MSEKISKKIEKEQFYHSKLFPKKDFRITKGKGALLYDEEGNEYIDCVAGHAVLNIGHSHPKYIKAMKEQLERVVMLPPSFPVDIRYKLLKKMADITPKSLTQTFLANSGTEAVEAGIKLALGANRNVKKPEIIAFKRAFHGRTLGSLAMTHNMRYRKPFIPWLTKNVKFASFGDIDSVKSLLSDNTIAIFIELVQGEGGVHPAPYDFVQELRELCDENDILLIDDEVQAGFGRTGKMFAFEHYDIVPDAMCMAKAIAGGFPMGAMISREDLFEKMLVGEHNTTYGGNPLGCAAANTVIDIIQEENLVENSALQGKKIKEDLLELAEEERLIREVRGKGLMIGVDYRLKVNDLINKAKKENVLLLNAGLSTIRLLPPLVITGEQVRTVLDVMHNLTN